MKPKKITSESTKATEARILKDINGAVVEQRLMGLAQIGGIVEKVGKKVPVNRLAFSEEDRQARVFLKLQMTEAGMRVIQYPFGLIGIYDGESSSPKPSIMLMSHFDSVPNGGAYDGAVGVVSAIEVVRAINKQGLRFPRPIRVLALTAEEASRYQIALLGSKMAFDGLTEEELQSKRPGDLTLAESLKQWGVDPQSVTKPTLHSKDIAAVIELHIEQNDRLAEQNIDLGIVEAISASDRREVIIGEPLTPDRSEYENAQYVQISVTGQADHSGATPMGKDSRADGFLPLADILIRTRVLQDQHPNVKLFICDVNVEGQALNKIPGKTSCTIKIGGDKEEIGTIVDELKNSIEERNTYYGQGDSAYTKDPIEIAIVNTHSKEESFYNPKEIMPSQELSGQVIKAVNTVAQRFGKDNIVGTVGTYNIKNGQIVLGVDIRGTNEKSIAAVWEEVQKKIASMNNDKTPYSLNKLPASAGPAKMDLSLIEMTQAVIEDHKIGSFERTFSPAGQDSQMTARRGIPTGMIFIPSRNDGVSHVPEEYSTPDDLEKGTKALAALTVRLASAE